MDFNWICIGCVIVFFGMDLGEVEFDEALQYFAVAVYSSQACQFRKGGRSIPHGVGGGP